MASNSNAIKVYTNPVPNQQSIRVQWGKMSLRIERLYTRSLRRSRAVYEQNVIASAIRNPKVLFRYSREGTKKKDPILLNELAEEISYPLCWWSLGPPLRALGADLSNNNNNKACATRYAPLSRR